VLGHEVGVLAQTIARTFDLDDDGVVKKPVQEGRGDDGVTERRGIVYPDSARIRRPPLPNGAIRILPNG
jgi:hypothetical protein